MKIEKAKMIVWSVAFGMIYVVACEKSKLPDALPERDGSRMGIDSAQYDSTGMGNDSLPIIDSSIIPRPDTIRPRPDTIRPRPDTLKPSPDTLRPRPDTLRPRPDTLKPRPDTLKPRPDSVRRIYKTRKP